MPAAPRIFAIRTAVLVTLAGAVVGGLLGWFGFGGYYLDSATGTYGWGPLMARVIALDFGIVALAQYVAVVMFRAIARAVRERVNASASWNDPANQAEWINEANWFAGMIYHSRRDRRTFVPKRVARSSFTINVANRPGFVLTVVLAIVLLVTLFSL